MSKKSDVLVIGELNVDIILNSIHEFPEIGKEVIADHMTITLGSSAAIFASNLSTLGTTVDFLGIIGNDQFGKYVNSALQEKKVLTSNIINSDQYTTGATIVLSVHEDRANITYPGAMEYLTINDATDQILSSAKHLHVSSVFLQTGLKNDLSELFQRAKRFGLTTSLDPQWDPAEKWDVDLKTVLPYVDIFVPNAAEMLAMSGTKNINEAIESAKGYSNVIAIKNGSSGAILWDKCTVTHQDAYLNPAVADAVGAGDSFNAGFIHLFLRGYSLQDCLKFAALTGAVNTTRHGGTTAFENYDMVKQIAESKFNYVL